MRRPGVLIVGCGNVAGGYDMAGGDARFPLSHAGAYRHHGGFDLRACVEPDDDRREGFMRHWGIAEGAASMQELLDRGCRVDVVAICSPTARHAEPLAAALRFGPRLVVCEKPVTPSLAETRHWVERYEAEGVALLTRRNKPNLAILGQSGASQLRAQMRRFWANTSN